MEAELTATFSQICALPASMSRPRKTQTPLNALAKLSMDLSDMDTGFQLAPASGTGPVAGSKRAHGMVARAREEASSDLKNDPSYPPPKRSRTDRKEGDPVPGARPLPLSGQFTFLEMRDLALKLQAPTKETLGAARLTTPVGKGAMFLACFLPADQLRGIKEVTARRCIPSQLVSFLAVPV